MAMAWGLQVTAFRLGATVDTGPQVGAVAVDGPLASRVFDTVSATVLSKSTGLEVFPKHCPRFMELHRAAHASGAAFPHGEYPLCDIRANGHTRPIKPVFTPNSIVRVSTRKLHCVNCKHYFDTNAKVMAAVVDNTDQKPSFPYLTTGKVRVICSFVYILQLDIILWSCCVVGLVQAGGMSFTPDFVPSIFTMWLLKDCNCAATARDYEVRLLQGVVDRIRYDSVWNKERDDLGESHQKRHEITPEQVARLLSSITPSGQVLFFPNVYEQYACRVYTLTLTVLGCVACTIDVISVHHHCFPGVHGNQPERIQSGHGAV
jgi:hypothetical protein